MNSKSGILILSLLIVGMFVVGCGRQAEKPEVPSEFRDIKPAPANPPLHFDEIKAVPTTPIPVVPPQGGGPLVRATSEGKELKGEHAYNGKLFADSPNAVRFVPENAPEIRVGFVLPDNFQLRQIQEAKGSLYISDNSSLAGADQIVTIQAEQRLLLSNIWQVSAKPIIYKPVDDVVLSQMPLEAQPGDNQIQAVEVSVNTNEGRKNVPFGKNFDFSVSNRKFTVFVHTSIFQSTSDEGDDTRTAYILRAMMAER